MCALAASECLQLCMTLLLASVHPEQTRKARLGGEAWHMHTLIITSLISCLFLSYSLCTMEPGSLLIITSLFCSYGSFLVLIWSVVCAGPAGPECEVCMRCITVYTKLSTRVADAQLSGAGMILGSEQKCAGGLFALRSAAHAAL